MLTLSAAANEGPRESKEKMSPQNIWNTKPTNYSDDLTYEDFVIEPKDATIVRFDSPITEGSQSSWRYKNMVTKDIGSDKVYLAWIYFEPKAGHDYHAHTCDESIFMIENEAQFTYLSTKKENVKGILRKGDSVFVPAGTPHSLWNISNKPCQFVVVKSPPYFLEEIPLPKELKRIRLLEQQKEYP